MKNRGSVSVEAVGLIAVVVLLIAGAGLLLWGIPQYKVYSQTLRGQAALREAEWTKKIMLEEANAAKQSEIARAEGVAEANRIIGESLQGNSEYLRYLWIQHLNNPNSKVIYVPTEANLPIMEAGRGVWGGTE